jgi:DnaK suppressor protein
MAELTDVQVQELRTELERELARLRRSMGSTGEAARPVQLDQSAIGRLSRVDAMANQQLQKDLHAREQALEGCILEALQRIDEGSYGRCTTCGEGVPYGRLLVMPEARTCATCGRS